MHFDFNRKFEYHRKVTFKDIYGKQFYFLSLLLYIIAMDI